MAPVYEGPLVIIIFIFPCSSVDSVAIFRFTFHLSRRTSHTMVHRVHPTLFPCHSVCFRGHYLSRMRCAPTNNIPAFIFPCSSVDSVAIFRFTFHLSRRTSHTMVHRVHPTLFPCHSVCFRGHYLSRMRCAPTNNIPAFIFPCSSVDSVAIFRFTFHLSRRTSHTMVHRVHPTLFPCHSVCFRGH